MQSLFIGLGAVMASILPWLLSHFFHVPQVSTTGKAIPLTVELSFQIGGAVFLATVLWTVLSTKEYPPQDMEAFKQQQQEQGSFVGGFKEIIIIISNSVHRIGTGSGSNGITICVKFSVNIFLPISNI